MNKPSILIIEDDKAVRNFIAATLEVHGYHYTQADKGKQGILSVASQRPDIVLLDLRLPNMDGVDVILKVRSWTNAPTIVISAGSKNSDKIAALGAGTDDCLTKPFSVNELLARFRFTQRRLCYIQSLGEARSSLFINGGLAIGYAAGCACLGGGELHPIPYEYKLLCLLAHNVEKVLIHSYIAREMWSAAWGGDVASLRVFMVSLRKKIERNPSQPQYIQTRVGVGYRMMKRQGMKQIMDDYVMKPFRA